MCLSQQVCSLVAYVDHQIEFVLSRWLPYVEGLAVIHKRQGLG